MTVVIGYVAEGRVWMGADSNTAEHPNGQIWERDRPKVWRTQTPDGETALLGFAGATGLELATRHGPQIPGMDGRTVEEWAQAVSHHIAILATENKHLISDGNDMDAIVMLAWRDRLWEVNFHFAVPCPRMGAAGCGRQVAWGALATLDRLGWGEPENRVRAAVLEACDWNDACRPPVFVEVTDAVQP